MVHVQRCTQPDFEEAKQRASITWLLTKVYNNRVPEELRDPYYRDHNDKECLKPNIIHALANAEYYCMALANIYADPNYHRLNHWGVIQALARKGVYIAEPSDVALTETVLIQTTPIKLSAHMAVIEAIMMLYIKEMITAERIVNCIQRISSLNQSQILPVDPEEALLLWINKCVDKLRLNIEKELESSPEAVKDIEGKLHRSSKNKRDPKGKNRESVIPPVFHKAQDLSDLTDGVLLCSVISLYCPLELEWTEIAFGDPMILSDSVYNLQLVVQFCEEYLPSHLSFVSIEDILYMHSSVKQNIVTFIAELFSAFEINTIKCVTVPTNDDNKYPYYGGKHPRTGTPSKTPKRNSQQNTSVPDLRSGYLQSSSLSELNRLGNNSNSSQRSPSEKSVPVTIKRHNSVQERDQNRRKIFGSSEGTRATRLVNK